MIASTTINSPIKREALYHVQIWPTSSDKRTRDDRKRIEHQDRGPLGKPQSDQPMRRVIAAALRRLASPQFTQHGDKSGVEDRHEKDQDRNSQDRKDARASGRRSD